MKILLSHIWKTLSILLLISLSTGVFALELTPEKTSREYNIGAFSKIDIGGAFDIVLQKGDTPQVKITTEDNIHEKIDVEVNNGTLKVKFKAKTIKNPPHILIQITFTEISSVKISGASNLSSASLLDVPDFIVKSSGASDIDLELKSDKLVVDVSGAGKMRLKGETRNLYAEVSGAGTLKAKELKVGKADISVSGAGDAYIDVIDTLKSSVSGAGSLNYAGNPNIKSVKKSGSGSIHPQIIEGKNVVIVDVQEDPENVNVKVGGLAIEVIESADTTRVTIGNHRIVIDDDGNVKYNRCRSYKFNGHWAGVDLGINGYINNNGTLEIPQGYDYLELNQAKSWTVIVNPFEQNFNLAGNRFGLITGIGFQWNNYRFSNNVVLSSDSSTIYGFKDNTRNYTKSKLTMCFLNVPILLEYQTNRHMKSNSFHITAGMIFGLRIGSHTKMVIQDGSKEKLKNRSDFHLHPFKMDANVRIGWGWINLFGTYSVTTLFKKDKGPELYPFTAGITLVGW